jgi:hypothetical protein
LSVRVRVRVDLGPEHDVQGVYGQILHLLVADERPPIEFEAEAAARAFLGFSWAGHSRPSYVPLSDLARDGARTPLDVVVELPRLLVAATLVRDVP